MKKILVFLLPFFLCIFAKSPKTWAQAATIQNPITISPLVTATVPAYFWLELTGWTSPWAQVELTMGQVIARLTTANDEGQFTFRIPLPYKLGHFCLIATDISRITSSPLCLPPPPPEVTVVVKQVVMPPTLKIEKGKILKEETVAAQGYTTPDSPVTPFIFEPKSWKKRSLLSGLFTSPALAAEAPKPPIKSDQNGYYQFNLPSNTLGWNRIFTGSIFLDNPSPKSNTLAYDILTWWRMLLERFFAFVGNLLWLVTRFLKSWKGLIILEIVVILGILFAFWRRRGGQRRKEVEQEKEGRRLIFVRY